MQTVTITCPECRGQIGVSSDDLGHHVQCPLCNKVILAQAPPPPAPAVLSPFEPVFDTSRLQDHESIFAPPEAASDDLFGEAPVPRLELSEPAPAPQREKISPLALSPVFSPASAPPAAVEETATFQGEAVQPPHDDEPTAIEAPNWQSRAEEPVSATSGPLPGPASEVVKRVARESQVAPLLLIFLIPYAIFSTACIVYLLWMQNNPANDPLLQMLDTYKRDGPAQRIKHDLPISPRQRTSLKQSLKIGDVEITPLQVALRPEGDLALYLRLKNASRDTQFNPLPDEFGKVGKGRGGFVTAHPYTFLEVGSKRAYGAYLDMGYWRGPVGQGERLSSGLLKPGEELSAVLVTDKEDRKLLAGVERAGSPLLWRVHLRRGFVRARNHDIPTTCVVGVEFTGRDIQHQAAPPPEPEG